jgi:nitric oxide reductase NorD protein
VARRRQDTLGSAATWLRRLAGRLADTLGAARLGSTRASRTVRLDDVRRRLELLVTAVYDRPIPIATVEAPRRRTLGAWRDALRPPHLRQSAPLPATDGERIQLPREIESTSADDALAQYRLMAIEQAERIARNTAARVAATATGVERDLYLMREGAVIDATIARAVPGLRATLAVARSRALESRPSLAGLSPRERAAETLLRQSLSGDLATDAARLPQSSPDESLAWAREQMRAFDEVRGKYRGLAPVPSWGALALRPPRSEPPPQAEELATLRGSKYGVGQFGRGTGTGGKQSSEGGREEGTSQLRRDGEVMPHPAGARRFAAPGAGDTTSTDADASEEEAPETGDDADAELAHSERAASRESRTSAAATTGRTRSRVPSPKAAGEGIEYPEWDWQAGDYRPMGAIVRKYEPDITTDTWGTTVLVRHGAIVRRLREQFDRLRARRTRLTQQRDGDELDLTACVRAWVDQRTGHTIDDRLYIAVRPARRGIAITLLIDISGSTDEWIDARRRVIDVEKIALLLASEALDALGDDYSILTFSGKGRGNVRMRTIKAFGETNGLDVRRRIGALEPEGYTRAGAAIRHATAQLERQPAAHRLLLMLSDGKPNDVDGYEGLSAVEDTRQAIVEARASGVYPFCLTIDRQGQEYLGRIFGEAGHTVLRNPRQLPTALVKVVKHLLAP